MQTLVSRSVRELAKEYFNGRLSFEDYRNSRQRLVDRLTGIVAEPEPEPEPETGTETTRPHRVEEKPPACDVSGHAAGQESVCETRRFPLPVIVLLAIGGLGAVGWIVFSGDKEVTQEKVARTAPVVEPAAVKAPARPGHAGQLISGFVQADDWSNEALTSFVLAWSALDTADQERARSSSGFRSLADGLREQILEQRALGDIAGTNDREAVLISVAEHIGALRLLADLKQTVINIDGGTESSGAGAETETSAEAQDGEPVPAAVKTTAPKPLVKKSPLKKMQAPVPVPPVVAKSNTKPVAKSTVKPVTQPAPAPVSARSAPVIRTPGKDPCPASLAKTRRPVCRDTLPGGEAGPIMVVLPAGTFQMGSQRDETEQPVHRVEITRPFAISAYEVSRVDYQRYCLASGKSCPAGHWRGERDPITNVSWNDARAYVEWLSQMTGRLYRLPTEAEWEYAARAGTTSEYPSSEGDKILPTDARFNTDSPLAIDDKSVNANGFRLRHMMGNVREWVADAWQENYRGAPGDGRAHLQPDNGKRVVRGGSYADDANSLRSAARNGLPVDTRDKATGFRVVREIRN